jgi:hypothetical protein
VAGCGQALVERVEHVHPERVLDLHDQLGA